MAGGVHSSVMHSTVLALLIRLLNEMPHGEVGELSLHLPIHIAPALPGSACLDLETDDPENSFNYRACKKIHVSPGTDRNKAGIVNVRPTRC